MKAHFFISTGLLITPVFVMRDLEALRAQGFGLQRFYGLGGFLLAALLVRAGWREFRTQ